MSDKKGVKAKTGSPAKLKDDESILGAAVGTSSGGYNSTAVGTAAGTGTGESTPSTTAIQRRIRANTITDQDLQTDDGQPTTPSKFQSLADTRTRNTSKYSAASTFKMEKRYGLFSAICVIVCVVIGSGIFINPQDAVEHSGTSGLALIIWFFMGIHSAVGALCYAELGTTLPVSGGDYAYINEAFGSFLGFQYQWCSSFLFIPAVNAILTKTVVTYFLDMVFFYSGESQLTITKQQIFTPVPQCNLNGTKIGDQVNCTVEIRNDTLVTMEGYSVWTDGKSSEYQAVLTVLEVVLLVAVMAGNCLTTKFAEKLQTYLTIAKLFACTLIIICGFYAIGSNPGFKTKLDPVHAFMDIHAQDASHPVDSPVTERTEDMVTLRLFTFGSAVYDVYFSFLGWTYLNFITEELDNPYRNLPIAIAIALPLITVVYLLMNLSYMAILTANELLNTKVIASATIKSVLPAGVQKGFYWVAPTVVMFSAFGALVGHTMAMSRVLFVAPRFDHAPMVFSHVHSTRLTPIPSLLLQTITSIIFIVIQNYTLVILMSCYAETSFTCIAIFGMIYLRYKRPELERPIKFSIILPIFFSTVSIILFLIPIITIFTDWNEQLVHIITIPMVFGFLGVFASGCLAFWVFVIYPDSKEKMEDIMRKWFHTERAD